MNRPLIGVDADGVALPFGDPVPFVENFDYRIGIDAAGGQLLHDPTLGKKLTELAAETEADLVWLSYRTDVLTVIAPMIGADWPALEFEPADIHSYYTTWKYNEVLAHTAGRPLLWFDDEHGRRHDRESRFVHARQAPTKLVHVNGELGLIQADLDEAREWLVKLRG